MIRLEKVTKYYAMKGGERHYVVKDIDLEIPMNKSLAILGPNGAGKSTLLRMIGGAEAPNSGKIITNASVSWPLGVGVGFQGSLTGRQNVLFVCQINGLTKSETKLILEGVQEFAELGKFFDMLVKTYSSGMRARLGFGLSINFDFDYYLIDELTSVGDAIFRKKAKAAFEEIRKRASLVFVAHNLNTLKESCESALFLRKGIATYHESIDEGIERYEEYIKEHQCKKPAKKAAAKKVAPKKAPAAKKAPTAKKTAAVEKPKVKPAKDIEQENKAQKEPNSNKKDTK